MSIQQWFEQRYQQFKEAQKLVRTSAEQASFNIFALSSINVEKENFHSDIISVLLNPNGLHKGSSTFLHVFIDYLCKHYQFNINKANYEHATVHREFSDIASRIDICIEGKGHAIIIENKMNNAPDAEMQIERYYELITKRNLEVDAIIYLTLDGIKQAPTPTIPAAASILKSIGAYTDQSNDLVQGWLNQCLEHTNEFNTKSFINEYTKLVKALNINAHERRVIQDFLKDVGKVEILPVLIQLSDNEKKAINTYRIQFIASQIQNYLPFTKGNQYPPYPTWFFEGYTFNAIRFQLSVTTESLTSVKVDLFGMANNQEKNRTTTHELLNNIKMLSAFQEGSNKNGYEKIFQTTHNLLATDAEVIQFINNLLQALRGVTA
ncbi:MAG TPA: hypothetical protein DCQ29_00290 [Chitinophagaceae bacterium]|nr:hypothetical protein [Chitinophagaceae bacterium]